MASIQVSFWGWVAFAGLVLALLFIDLLSHRGQHGQSRRSAYGWTAAWIALGLGFGAFVWRRFGGRAGEEYLGAYLIEKSLSLDNLFVFLVIFQSLGIPREKQRTVLFWGILGALVFRGLFVFAGVQAIERWHAVVYGFGALLIVVAVRVAMESPAHKKGSRVVEWLVRRLPVTTDYLHAEFVVRRSGRLMATPLLVALLAIELTDIAFAIDSVPAAFAISREPFIVYSSNVFAILGLRALYVALAHTIAELKYLHFGLAAVLAFAGLKMISSDWIHVPALTSIAIIVALIGAAVAASLFVKPRTSP